MGTADTPGFFARRANEDFLDDRYISGGCQPEPRAFLMKHPQLRHDGAGLRVRVDDPGISQASSAAHSRIDVAGDP